MSNVDVLRALNPQHEYRLYENDDMADFLGEEVGPKVRDQFLRITKDYGAAKADFFRYFLIYKIGGIYLDLKSTGIVPFDDVLRADDTYILSQWQNDNPLLPYYGWGLYDELVAVSRGEYQQWHIIAEPGHPFLAAVIELMLERLAGYTPWRTGFGHLGVIRTTGPITYTQAIHPLRASHKHRLIEDETAIGLRFSVFKGKHDHRAETPHYGTSFNPVISLRPTLAPIGATYLGMRQASDKFVKQPLRSLVRWIRSN